MTALPKLAIRDVHLIDGLVMEGDHSVPAGRRHWRATASAFCIKTHAGDPLVWVGGGYVWGAMEATVMAPDEAFSAEPYVPAPDETLLRWECVRVGGRPMLRTWWAKGANVARTQRVARLELWDSQTWPDRVRQLLQLMNWVG